MLLVCLNHLKQCFISEHSISSVFQHLHWLRGTESISKHGSTISAQNIYVISLKNINPEELFDLWE